MEERGIKVQKKISSYMKKRKTVQNEINYLENQLNVLPCIQIH